MRRLRRQIAPPTFFESRTRPAEDVFYFRTQGSDGVTSVKVVRAARDSTFPAGGLPLRKSAALLLSGLGGDWTCRQEPARGARHENRANPPGRGAPALAPMTTLTDSVPHSLKLALHTTTANEWSEAPDYAYLEISPVQAQAMLDLLRVTNEFRTHAARAGLLNRFFAISVGTGEMIPNFRMIWIPLQGGQEPDPTRTAVALPEEFDPECVGAANEYRVECHRIELGDERVRFTALLKHGSDQFTTADLDQATLEAIAEERATGIPVGLMSDEWKVQ